MVYSESELKSAWGKPIRFSNGSSITVEKVQELIQQKADENGIPVAFLDGEIKIGGLFSKEREKAVTMYHPDYNGYQHILIRVKHQGNFAFVYMYITKGSANYANENKQGLVSGITKLVSGHDGKWQAEKEYYEILGGICDSIAF